MKQNIVGRYWNPFRLALAVGLLVAALGVHGIDEARADNLTVCASGCDHASIQAAIDAAGVGGVITVTDAEHTEANIVVDNDVIIQGQGAANTTVQAGADPDLANGRVFEIKAGVTATIRDMSIQNGRVIGSPAQGGGIQNAGDLTLQRIVLRDNTAEGQSGNEGEHAFGGGIHNSGTLSIMDSTIQGNTAQGGSAGGQYGDAGDANGAGIYNAGSLALRDVVLRENAANGGAAAGADGVAGGAYGGGLYNSGLLKVQYSTIDSNFAQGGVAQAAGSDAGDAYGAGIAQWWSSADTVTIANSTVSTNTAHGGQAGAANSQAGNAYGGGVAHWWLPSGALILTNSTISGNSARGGDGLLGQASGTAEGGGIRGSTGLEIRYCAVASNQALGGTRMGGGLYSSSGAGSGPILQSSIVSDNGGPPDADGPDVAGHVQSQDYNLIENPNGYTWSGATGNNIEGSDAQLGSLQDNGGSTLTHALAEGSAPVDQIPAGTNGCGTMVAQDQRSVGRPEGESCDIGAYELRKTGQLAVIKELVPADDPGRFHLQIDGATQKTDAANGDTSGYQTVYVGSHTVGEAAGTDTDLADYDSSIECRDDGGSGSLTASGIGAGPLTVTVQEGDSVVCIIRNERKTGWLEVVKDLAPDIDPGRFHLQIDANTEQPNAGDGDSTGAIELNTGAHAVGEAAAAGTTLGDYTSTIECRDNGGQGSVVASHVGAGPLTVTVEKNDSIVCTIRNERKTGWLEVVKDLVPSTDPGRFRLQIDSSVERSDAGDGDSTGKVHVNTGAHTVGELADAGTTLSDYTASIECRDDNGDGKIVASGTGSGPLALTVGQNEDIVCTVRNERKTGRLEVVKGLVPDSDPGHFDLQIDGNTERSDAGDGDSTGSLLVNTGAHTVGEVAGSETSLASYVSNIECRDDGGSGAVVASSQGSGPMTVVVSDNDDIVCSVRNARRTGSLEVVNRLLPIHDSGRFDLQIDGVTVKANAADGDRTGAQTVGIGTHTVGEVAGMNTDLADYDINIECRDDGGTGVAVASGYGPGPLSITVGEAQHVVCTIQNTRFGTIVIEKQTAPGGGSGFGFADDIAPPNRFILDSGQTKTFGKVVPGDYVVTEDDPASMPGNFVLTSIVCSDSDSSGTPSTGSPASRKANINLDPAETVHCSFANVEQGTITIIKDARPDFRQEFSFSGDLGNFALRDLEDSNSRTFSNLPPGVYNVREAVPADWHLMSIDCLDSDGRTTVDLASATAHIDLDSGEHIVCTFENAQLPDLSITKTVTPATVMPGEPVTYTLVYGNEGRDFAPEVTVTDSVPEPLTGVRFQSSPSIVLKGPEDYTWGVGVMLPGASGIITLTGVIRPDLVMGLVFTNHAAVTTTVPEWNADNNAGSAQVLVVRTAPEAFGDQFTAKQNAPLSSAPLSVLDNDVDLQGDPLSAVLDRLPGHGELALSLDGTFVYTPTRGFLGHDSFTYLAHDGALDSNVATVIIDVRPTQPTVYLPIVIRHNP